MLMAGMQSDALAHLQTWLAQRANGKWEHQYGVTIASLDNPGWSVIIDLVDTPLESRPFKEVQYENNPKDWLTCRIRNSKFEAYGDPQKLTRMLEEFAAWAFTN